MDLFATVKSAVTVREAARHYGFRVGRNGMACCPFHDDRHPSLKLNQDYFYCFGYGATGDVIELVARLFNLPLMKRRGSWRLISDLIRTSRPSRRLP